MKNLIKEIKFLVVLGFLFCPYLGLAADAPVAPPDYYQSALQAYLTGDFDQAILLDSKAIQLDPKDKKAGALLSILVSEKDNANKTVIWIGGKPVIAQNNPLPTDAPVTVFKEKVTQIVQGNNAGGRKLAELEARVQTVAFLMERDSFSQYRELSGAQIQTTKRLDEISYSLRDLGFGMKFSNLLFLLALAMAGLALWKSWKNGQEIRKQRNVLDQPQSLEERSRVVNIRRI